MPVTLESRARRMQVFLLPHDVFCRDQCACAEVTVVVIAENPRTGERAPKHVLKTVPGSITFLALERKPGLPSVLLELAQVKAAIGRGYLRVIEQASVKAAAPGTAGAGTGSPVHALVPPASEPPHTPGPPASSATSSPASSAASPAAIATAAVSLAYSPAPAVSSPSPVPAAKAPGKEP